MDNDNKMIHLIKEIAKTGVFKISFFGKKILNENEGNKLIGEWLDSEKPFAIGRFGAVEARCINKYIKNIPYSEYNITSIKEAAGFFPNEPSYMNDFSEQYLLAAQEVNLLAVWGVEGERKIVDRYCPKAYLTKILALEPYFYKDPWSKHLKNKKVLIIHPFTETIRKQLENNRTHIFQNVDVLPEFKSVSYIKAVQSNAEAKTEFNSWFDALNYMCKEIDRADFDVAIIGAGAYGLPLAAYCKKIGKQAIQMAGAMQILFGIRGKRWESRTEYMSMMNSYWVRPSKRETPEGIQKVEGGSYW